MSVPLQPVAGVVDPYLGATVIDVSDMGVVFKSEAFFSQPLQSTDVRHGGRTVMPIFEGPEYAVIAFENLSDHISFFAPPVVDRLPGAHFSLLPWIG